ncbi:hypothetical protein BDZ91DRAFT_801961 [Kalaharituber pfeilii]|nr:hypothetical protein BDZ91DRAFT_801961 [Kalaharituber pfeilii]
MAPNIPNPGEILWLSCGENIKIDPGKLNHLVVVVGEALKGKVVICLITSFGDTRLETKFKDPKMRSNYLPLYFDPPNSQIDNDPEGGLKVTITHGSPFIKRSYLNTEPFEVPTAALLPLKHGAAVLDWEALAQLRSAIERRNLEWKGELEPTQAKGKNAERTSARKQGPSLAGASYASRSKLTSPAGPSLASASDASRSNLTSPIGPSLASTSRASPSSLTSRMASSPASVSHASRPKMPSITGPSLASTSQASRSNLAPPIAPSLASASHASHPNLTTPIAHAPWVPVHVYNCSRVETPNCGHFTGLHWSLWRILQCTFAIATIVIWGGDVHAAQKTGQALHSDWIFSLVISCMSLVVALIWLLPCTKSHRLLFADVFLALMWLIVFGIWAKNYIPRNCHENYDCQQLKYSVWFSLAALLFWLSSAVYGFWRFRKERKGGSWGAKSRRGVLWV